MTVEEYRTWMCDPKNEMNCTDCPENRGMSDWQERKPCGQQNCWVTRHKGGEDE